MEHTEYEYIVIGAGIAGLSAAYHLVKDGYSVLVLEATDGSESASMASTAEMNHDPDANWDNIVEQFGIGGAKLLWKLCSDGIDLLSEFAHQSGEPHFGTDRVPAYFFSYRNEDTEILKKKYDFYTSIGAHVSLDTASSLHPNFHAVLTTHGEGVTNNQMLLKTLAHEVRERGGSILHNCPVSRLHGNRVITESGEEYLGKQIIVATGDGADLLSWSSEIEKKRTFVISYQRHDLPEFFRTSVMWDTDKPYHYVRSFGGNRLWIGGEDVYERDYVSSEENDGKKYAALEQYAREVLGTDDSYVHQSAWNGPFYPAKRGLPYIGVIPGTPHIASVGFGGTGIITSFLSGYLLAAWKRGELLDYQPLFAADWE
jgi:glycine/D-amino acid oxidase-like deaminating enzyme